MSRRGLYVTVGGGVLVMAALLVAALGAPVQVVSRPPASSSITLTPSPGITPPQQTPTVSQSTAGALPFDPSPLLVVLVQVLLVGTALLLLTGLLLLLRSLWKRPHLTVHREPDFVVPPVPEELLGSARRRLDLLESGEPRNAIVAAWLDLESSAAATGLPRQPAETSTEYTARVIGTWAVDRVRLADLAALYREARFSKHDLGEEHRRRAVADLLVLHDDLERVAREGSAPEHAP